jgi:hypothetical protein
VFQEHQRAQGATARGNNMRVANVRLIPDATISVLVIGFRASISMVVLDTTAPDICASRSAVPSVAIDDEKLIIRWGRSPPFGDHGKRPVLCAYCIFRLRQLSGVFRPYGADREGRQRVDGVR